MSIKWDAANDAKLFTMVIQHFNIKLGGEKLKNLNIAMGLAPNSQSLTHRLAFLKKQGSQVNAGASAEVKSVTPRANARKTKTPKKKRVDSVVDDDEFSHPDDVSKSEPGSDPEFTPFFNGGTKALKRKSGDADEDEEPTEFTRSLMAGKKAASPKKKKKVVKVEADEEEDGFTMDMPQSLWDDEELTG